jgi:hypothetical protein
MELLSKHVRELFNRDNSNPAGSGDYYYSSNNLSSDDLKMWVLQDDMN